MRPPCEIIVTKILPAIRTVLVKDLIERHDLTQKEVSERLGVTQAAVSQYLSSIRGDEELERKLENSEVFDEIQDLSDKIVEEDTERSQIIGELCEVCETLRKEGILCEIHTDSAPGLAEDGCDVCLKS